METKQEEQCKQGTESPKRCFCSKCFMPIDPEDKVEVDGQQFHRGCSMCYPPFGFTRCLWPECNCICNMWPGMCYECSCPWLWRKECMESICHKIPKSIKMFYGHVFCDECFKTHVLNRFRGETPQRMQTNSWWMQFGPGMNVSAQGAESGLNEDEKKKNEKEEENATKDKEEEKDKEEKKEGDDAPKKETEPPQKRCYCARCLHAVDDKYKIEIGGQTFHPQCARCCYCHAIPKDNVKIYYGQVFCEDCFNRFVLARDKDTRAEHFQACFAQMQKNSQFAESMREFMAGNGPKSNVPIVFMMPGAGMPEQAPGQPPFCRCGGPHPEARNWFPTNEPRKSATTANQSIGEDSVGMCDVSFEYRPEDLLGSNGAGNTTEFDLYESKSQERAEYLREESASLENLVAAAEKIGKLTNYLDSESKKSKKWKNFFESNESNEVEFDRSWVNLQDPEVKQDENCPKCMWQCGLIYVNVERF